MSYIIRWMQPKTVLYINLYQSITLEMVEKVAYEAAEMIANAKVSEPLYLLVESGGKTTLDVRLNNVQNVRRAVLPLLELNLIKAVVVVDDKPQVIARLVASMVSALHNIHFRVYPTMESGLQAIHPNLGASYQQMVGQRS